MEDVVVHVHLKAEYFALVDGGLKLHIAPALAFLVTAWEREYLLGERGGSRGLRLARAAA